MIVSKFGGTSVGTFEAMQRSAKIISSNSNRRLIVISAVAGTTNDLVALSKSGDDSTSKEEILQRIEKRHHSIIEHCDAKETVRTDFDLEFSRLREHLDQVGRDKRWKDTLYAFGEFLSTKIFVHVLKQNGVDANWLDARKIIRTDSAFGNAVPMLDAISKNSKKFIQNNQVYLTQGFIGSDIFGNTTTLGRGGSDFSAALFSEALKADVLEIWTDVAGLYTTDPRIISDATPIHEVSFDEAAELSVFGGKVLHPATLKPAIRGGIGVKVASSHHPELPGTLIIQEPENKPAIRAISLRKKQTLLTVNSLEMHKQSGFMAKLFNVLAKHNISVDLVSTSEVSVALTIDKTDSGAKNGGLSHLALLELEEFAEVKVENELALVALIGNKLHSTPGIGGPIFMELENFNIRMICYGSSSNSLCFLVKEEQAEHIVQTLHKRFIANRVTIHSRISS